MVQQGGARDVGAARARRGTPAVAMMLLLIVVPTVSALALSVTRIAALGDQREQLDTVRSAGDQLADIGTARALLSDERNAIGLLRVVQEQGIDLRLASLLVGFDLEVELGVVRSAVDDHLSAAAPDLLDDELFANRASVTYGDPETLNERYRLADERLADLEAEQLARLQRSASAVALEEIDPALTRLQAATDAHRHIARMGSAYATVLAPSLAIEEPAVGLRFLYQHRLGYDDAITVLGADGRTVPSDDDAVAALLAAVDATLAGAATEGIGGAAVLGDGLSLDTLDPADMQPVTGIYRASTTHRDSTAQAAAELAASLEAADAEAAAAIGRSLAVSVGLVIVTLAAAAAATFAFVRPLHRLAEGARQLRDGEVGVQTTVGGVRELQSAIRALNEASSSIAVAHERTRALAAEGWEAEADVVGESGGLEAGVSASFDVLESLMADRERLRAHLEHEAFHDSLTGLLNRRGLRHRIDDLLAQPGGEDEPLLVLYLDLDGFKAVNDRHGHEAGDRVLVAVAERLDEVVPVGSLVARMGGDEFMVVVSGAAEDAGARLGAEVKARIAEPVVDGARQLTVGASVGLASGAPGATGFEQLIRGADSAAYYAKANRSPVPVSLSPEIESWMGERSVADRTPAG
ncbi:MAG: diguanylate cyclase [Actinomycetota bacterium]